MRKVHIINPDARNALINAFSSKSPPPPQLGLPGHQIAFRRFVAATETGLHDALSKEHGEDYGQALIDGDPDADIDVIGRGVERTENVLLTSTGELLYSSPKTLEIILGPDGEERERREPQEVVANVNEELPIRWTGRKFDKEDAVRQFVFAHTLQLRHSDALTYDFLFQMAKELDEEGKLVLLGAGDDGKAPLIFQTNGSPYRGLMEGRVDGEKYKLLIHLTNIELKALGG